MPDDLAFERPDAGMKRLGIDLRRVLELVDSGRPFVEGTVVAAGMGAPVPVGMRFAYVPQLSSGARDRVEGAPGRWTAPGGFEGTTGVEAVDHALVAGAEAALRSEAPSESRVGVDGEVLAPRRRQHQPDVSPGTFEVAWQPHVPQERLAILGAGHVAVPLCAMATTVGYAVTVVDDRARFATAARFPGAREVLVRDFESAIDAVGITPWTSVVLVTRGHEHDEACLARVAASPARYVGMIGSRRRVKVVHDRLRAAGVPAEALDRVHAPIGLDLGGRSPEEIALSILAELVLVRRGGLGDRLSARRLPGVRDAAGP